MNSGLHTLLYPQWYHHLVFASFSDLLMKGLSGIAYWQALIISRGHSMDSIGKLFLIIVIKMIKF